jgi:hypothetical protein
MRYGNKRPLSPYFIINIIVGKSISSEILNVILTQSSVNLKTRFSFITNRIRLVDKLDTPHLYA